jgi:hypothetical protein
MVFGGAPLTLRGWTLVDGQGQATKVKITSLAPTPIKPELFVLSDPRSPDERGIRPKVVNPSAAPAAKPKPDQDVTASAK